MEKDFKGAALKRWRKEGYEVQCFEDKLSGGIADTLVGWAGGGVWIEWKWISELPTRTSTPLPVEFRPGQIPWLLRWHGKPLPTAVVLGSPKGFLVVPGPKAKLLTELPHKHWTWIDDAPSMTMVLFALRATNGGR